MTRKQLEKTQIGDRIKIARTAARLTQPRLAEMLKTNGRQIQRWEANDNLPAADAILDIAAALGVTPGFILGDFPRTSATWHPWIVIPTTSKDEETEEHAKKLIEDWVGDEWDMDGLFDGGWATWEDGALVLWADGPEDDKGSLEFAMYVRA